MKRTFLALVILAYGSLVNAQPVTFTGQELLGRPTNSSITVNVVANQPLDAYFEYGTIPGVYTSQTPTVSSPANEPIEAVISGLQTNTKYYYRMVYRVTGNVNWIQRTERSFHTQRPATGSFKFDITSDSHVNILLGTAANWLRTLTNIAADSADFLIDCGDTFSMDNVTSETGARSAYLFQRSATTFGLVSPSVPVFLAIGNHEEQEAWHLNDNGNPVNSQPVWATNAQKRYFLNPVPNTFYSGNSDTYYALDGDKLREDYYAWTWGKALFVVIDPYWYTLNKPFIGNTGGGEPGPSDGDRWHWTLGSAQYNWLKTTLENSTAEYKFLFMHHMTGGTEDYIRAGAYAAPFCEWGGYNENGTTYAFNTRRPGWYAPVHQLLVENQVSAVFHGHDHQYAYEIRDGVVYQSLPAAGFSGNGFNIYSENDPLTIKVLPSQGHLRVSVSPTEATVDYISSNTATNGQLLYSYTIAPQGGPLPVKIEYFTVHTEQNKKVILKWKTAFESNNKHFIVQRTTTASGAFKNIGIVASANSPNGSIYSFIDEPGQSGSYLYRFVQEDMDGKKTNSETRAAILKNYKYLHITTNINNWQIQSDQLTSYTLFDMQGQLLESGRFSGLKIINKPASGAAYILRTECGGEIITHKLMCVPHF